MVNLIKNRTKSIRLTTWDYRRTAAYFITICTKDRKHFFGSIIQAEMHLSAIGKIAATEWIRTPVLRPDMNLESGEFIIMPNHFHAIVTIGENKFNSTVQPNCGDAKPCVSKETNYEKDFRNTFAPQSKNLAALVRGFKSTVTLQARQIDPDFGWQSRFHDHIIRNEQSFLKIPEYIKYNPLTWEKDKLHSPETELT